MIRLHSIGAAAFALSTLALPTFALTHGHAGQADAPRHPRSAAGRQSRRGRHDRPGPDDGADGLRPRGAATRPPPTTPPTPPRRSPRRSSRSSTPSPPTAPNRFAGWSDALQANVAIVQRFLSAQDGGTKGLRLDMGTNCGAQYVDIQVVALPGARAAYADNFGAISSAVQRALGAAGGPRNAVVLADGLSGATQEYGLGETVMGTSGEQQGAKNVHNRGGLTSVLFSRDGAAAPGAARWGWWPEGFLHEMTHNLGAVQWGAPHSTQPRGQQLTAVRPLLAGRGRHVLHRGRRRRAPDAAGLRRAARRDPAELRLRPRRLLQPGAGRGLLPGDALEHLRIRVPRAVRRDRPGLRRRRSCGCRSRRRRPPAPTVGGTLRRGSTLTAGNGAWSNGPTGYTYQWQRLAAAGWENIDGETDATYIVTQRGPRPPTARHGDRHQPGRQRHRRLRPDRPGRRLRRQPRREPSSKGKSGKRRSRPRRAQRRRTPRRRPPPRRRPRPRRSQAKRR